MKYKYLEMALNELLNINSDGLKPDINKVVLAGHLSGAKDVMWIAGHYPEMVLGGKYINYKFLVA